MDVSPLTLARVLVPQIPNVFLVAILALLHLSTTSPFQDILTQVLVSIVRPVLSTPACIALSQRQTSLDLPIRGPIWVSKITLPRPNDGDIVLGPTREGIDGGPADTESHVREGNIMGPMQAIRAAMKVLGDGKETWTEPEIVEVEAEWNSYRSNAGWWSGRPDMSEREQYDKMMEDVGDDGPTILYLHGGAFVLMDPSTHRLFTTRLAYLSSSRCLSVRFRMAPKHPFPTSLLDCLIAYLSLLSPSPSDFHSAVPASCIVFTGDSSGAALATSLTLLLLTLKNTLDVTYLRFNGENVPLVLPAGLATLHPYLDVARSLPSVTRNRRYDVITPPGNWPSPLFPADALWPSNPPRVETYCDAVSVVHPLVSPVAAPKYCWRGCPPVYVALGWEALEDEISVWARRVYQADETNVVVFDGYVGQPHCFEFLAPWTKLSRKCFWNWAGFCRGVLERPKEEESGSDGSSVTIIDDGGELTSMDTGNSRGSLLHGFGTSYKSKPPAMLIERVSRGTWTTRYLEARHIQLDDLAMAEDIENNIFKCDDDTVQNCLEVQRTWRIDLEKMILRQWRYIVRGDSGAHGDDGSRVSKKVYVHNMEEMVWKWWNTVGKGNN